MHAYTDNSYPSLNGLEYDIEVFPTFPCLAEKAQDHNTTRSNRHTIAPPNPNHSTSLMYRMRGNLHLAIKAQAHAAHFLAKNRNGTLARALFLKAPGS